MSVSLRSSSTSCVRPRGYEVKGVSKRTVGKARSVGAMGAFEPVGPADLPKEDLLSVLGMQEASGSREGLGRLAGAGCGAAAGAATARAGAAAAAGPFLSL